MQVVKMQELVQIKKYNSHSSTYTIYETPSTKDIILKHIDIVPGIRYRELLRLSGLTNGTLEYTIRRLETVHKIKVERKNGMRARYYPNNMLEDELHVLGHIRNPSSRQIIYFILEHDLCTFGEILKHVKKARSTLSCHLKRLSQSGIISVIHRKKFRHYTVSNINLMTSLIYKYGFTAPHLLS